MLLGYYTGPNFGDNPPGTRRAGPPHYVLMMTAHCMTAVTSLIIHPGDGSGRTHEYLFIRDRAAD